MQKYFRGSAKKFKMAGGGGGRADSFIRLKDHYLKNALNSFAIFYAYDSMGYSWGSRYANGALEGLAISCRWPQVYLKEETSLRAKRAENFCDHTR